MGSQTVPVEFISLDSKTYQAPFWRLISIAERFIAGMLLIALTPALSLIGLVITALSRQSPIIAHRRVGQGGRPIWILKLRTMWDTQSTKFTIPTLIEHLGGEMICPINVKKRLDPRVTSRFAAICRRFSIDELPQLWHVARGEMALLGPRPLTADEIRLHYHGVAAELLTLKPGLSGLWQINGRSRLNYRQRKRCDLFMVRKWSAGLYFRILWRTIPTVLKGTDAW